MLKKPQTVALISGGLDSATVVGLAKEAGHEVIGLSFDYGQRHSRELEAAKALAGYLKVIDHQIIKINLASWGGSSLTDFNQTIPMNGVKEQTIPTTYVPGRNTVFIAIGLSLAEARGAEKLALGINAMDYSGYPDCRPDYLETYQKLATLSSKIGREGNGIKVWAPLITWSKKRIIQEALRLKIPIEETWSCYVGKDTPCGKCDSCRIRDQALLALGKSELTSANGS